MIKFRLRRLILSFFFATMATACFAQTANVNFTANSTWIEPRFPNDTPGVATYDYSISPVSAALVALDPSLDGAFKFDFTVTTSEDILVNDALISNTPGQNVPGGYFNYVNANNFGSDVSPPNPALFPVDALIELDAFVTTPGPTGASGPATFDNLAGELYVTHFDSVDLGAATDFTFASLTLIPDASGAASATLAGQIQVRNQPEPLRSNYLFELSITPPVSGCTDPMATNYDPTATVDDGSCMFPPTEVNFEDGINSTNPTDDFFSMFGTNQDLTDANDPGLYPNGATLFVPTNQAIADALAAGISWDVADLIVPDSTSGNPSGPVISNTLGYDEDDLDSLVGTAVGSTSPLTAVSGNVFELERGSLLYGGGTIVETNFDVDNGWIHVIDAIPVPEPGSFGLLLTALLGLSALRRR